MKEAASILVLAPHCDDETLGAAGVIILAAAEGIPVRIVMMTNGDGFNPYALATQHRRLHLTPAQFIQFARLRQAETRAAVRALGLSEGNVHFLGYPDRGLAAMWDRHWEPENPYYSRFTKVNRSPYPDSFTPHAPFCGRAVVDDLKAILREARPTHIITPHPHDAHSDHWATYCFALYALEELVQEGESFAESAQILGYLIHRGRWPRPGGYRPELPLFPPRQYYRLPLPWVTLELTDDVVRRKFQALMAYTSQLRFMRNYLLSFVRRNELFGLFTALPVPALGRDGSAAEHPWAGAASKRAGSHSLVPEGAFCEVLDPVPTTWAGRVRRAGDIRSVQTNRDQDYLYLRMNLGSRASRNLRYCITIYGAGIEPGRPPVRNRLHVEVQVPDRVRVTAEGQWSAGVGTVQTHVARRQLQVAIPLSLLRYPERIFLGVETRFGRFVLDQVAWHMLVLGGGQGELPHLLDATAVGQ